MRAGFKDHGSVMKFPHEWWRFRKEELLALVHKKCPLYVYNEETLNDTLFDLLAIDAMDGLFYPVHENPHPRILRKVFELGAGFTCISSVELDALFTLFPKLAPQRVLFVPDDAHDKDFERAVRYGAHIVVKDRQTLKMLPDILKNRKIFIPMDMDVAKMDIEASVEGFYIHPKINFPFLSDIDRMTSCLVRASRQFPDASTFILGNGMGVSVNREKDVMDIPVTGYHLEAIKDACPQCRLWLEPGRHMVSHAGVLLARVRETDHVEGRNFVRIHVETAAPLYDGLHGTRHEIVNLSKPDEEAPILSHVTGQGRGPGRAESYLKGPASTEKGDILIFTNMGAGPGRDFIGKGRHLVSEHYLNARRICSVKI